MTHASSYRFILRAMMTAIVRRAFQVGAAKQYFADSGLPDEAVCVHFKRPARAYAALCSPIGLRRMLGAVMVAALFLLSGCGSFLAEGTSAGAGIAGTAIADSMTDNAALATGIGLGVQAVAKAGLQYAQRNTREEEQDAIAQAAASLQVGEVGEWAVIHSLPIEADAQGKVTVSRLIGGIGLACKELVFSVVAMKAPPEAPHAYYVTTICEDQGKWRWASAEPATARWGSLQ